MPDDERPGGIRTVTRELIRSAVMDTWPSQAAVMDFGIDSDRHLGALHYALKSGEATPAELDAAMGNGAKLTEIAQRGNNPYRDVSFRTAWDDMPLEPDWDEPIVPAPEVAPIKEVGPLSAELERIISAMEASWLSQPEPSQPEIEQEPDHQMER